MIVKLVATVVPNGASNARSLICKYWKNKVSIYFG